MELPNLVAPIALYPDALVARSLAATTNEPHSNLIRNPRRSSHEREC